MDKKTIKTLLGSISLLVLIGCILYANTLNVPFHFDDKNNIQNPSLRIEVLNTEQIKKSIFESTLKSRPISNLSFAINYFVGGDRVQGYHLVNIGIHLCTGIFLYLLLRLTLDLTINKKKYPNGSAIALMTALLWMAHPLGTQSVTYIVQRMNSLASMFFVLSMLLYAIGRKHQVWLKETNTSGASWGWFGMSGLSSILALGSKEISATIPFFIFLYEWYFFQDLRWEWLKKKLYWLVGGFLIIASIACAYTNGQIIDRIFNSCGGRDFTMLERVLTQFRVVVHYITLVFYPNPNRLVLDYDFPVSTSLFSPLTTLYSLVALVALVALSVLIARRERLVSFCIFWFFGNLVIESSVICLELVFEHRTYLPSMFLILLFVGLVYRIGKNTFAISILLLFLTSVIGYWTIERNKIWQTSTALWSDSISKYPNKARSHHNLALALIQSDELESAESELLRALEIDPTAEIIYQNLAILRLKQRKDTEAEAYLHQALNLNPDYAEARINLGGILRKRGLYKEAAEQFIQVLNKNPDDPVINKNYGNAILRSGQPADALPYLEKSLLYSPEDIEVLLDKGEILSLLGRSEEAIGAYRKILDIDKNQESAHYHIAILLKMTNLKQEALSHYGEADRLMRCPVALKYDYGNLLFMVGDLPDAEKIYKDFLTVIPTVAMTYNNLGLVLINQGRLIEAITQFQAALNIAPHFQPAADNLRIASEELRLKKKNE